MSMIIHHHDWESFGFYSLFWYVVYFFMQIFKRKRELCPKSATSDQTSMTTHLFNRLSIAKPFCYKKILL